MQTSGLILNQHSKSYEKLRRSARHALLVSSVLCAATVAFIAASADAQQTVEVGNWEYAFESLNSSSRERIESAFRLRWGVTLSDDPDFGIPARELLVESIRYRKLVAQDDAAGVAKVLLTYIGPDATGSEVVSQIPVFLDREPVPAADPDQPERREWFVDLVGSLQQLFGQRSEPPAP